MGDDAYFIDSNSNTGLKSFASYCVSSESFVPQLGRFNGENPVEWVFHAEQYFTFYGFSEDSWLSLPLVYFDGDALAWFQWLYRNDQFYDWKHFTEKLLLQFQKRNCCAPRSNEYAFGYDHAQRLSGTYSYAPIVFPEGGNTKIAELSKKLNCLSDDASTKDMMLVDMSVRKTDIFQGPGKCGEQLHAHFTSAIESAFADGHPKEDQVLDESPLPAVVTVHSDSDEDRASNDSSQDNISMLLGQSVETNANHVFFVKYILTRPYDVEHSLLSWHCDMPSKYNSRSNVSQMFEKVDIIVPPDPRNFTLIGHPKGVASNFMTHVWDPGRCMHSSNIFSSDFTLVVATSAFPNLSYHHSVNNNQNVEQKQMDLFVFYCQCVNLAHDRRWNIFVAPEIVVPATRYDLQYEKSKEHQVLDISLQQESQSQLEDKKFDDNHVVNETFNIVSWHLINSYMESPPVKAHLDDDNVRTSIFIVSTKLTRKALDRVVVSHLIYAQRKNEDQSVNLQPNSDYSMCLIVYPTVSSHPFDPGENSNFDFNSMGKELTTSFVARISVLFYSNLEDKVLIEAGSIVMNGPDLVLANQPKTNLSGYVWDPG